MSRVAAFWACLVAFGALTVALIAAPALGDLDEAVARVHPKSTWTVFVPWVRAYEVLGQRGPTLLVATPLVVWWAWRRRDRAPVVALVVSELLLNAGVGIAKILLGRVGPFAAGDAHRFFAGGDIYPSGHVSNSVVLYGLLAGLASLRWRRAAILGAALVSLTVGLGTIFLRTHWLTDVVGGWLAGALVLLALPSVLPVVDRAVASAVPVTALHHVCGVLSTELRRLVPRERTGSHPESEHTVGVRRDLDRWPAVHDRRR